MFILYGDEHQLMPNENRVILRLQNENGRWNRESYVLLESATAIDPHLRLPRQPVGESIGQ